MGDVELRYASLASLFLPEQHVEFRAVLKMLCNKSVRPDKRKYGQAIQKATFKNA